jgi:hypothetical protein
MAQGVGPEFKPGSCKKKKVSRAMSTPILQIKKFSRAMSTPILQIKKPRLREKLMSSTAHH